MLIIDLTSYSMDGIRPDNTIKKRCTYEQTLKV